MLIGPLPLVTQGMESGAALLKAKLPPVLPAAAAHVQAFVAASTAAGVTASNAVRLTFVP